MLHEVELALSTAGAAVDSDYVYTMGYTDGFGADALDIFLVKYDKDDNQIWNVTWYDSGAYKVTPGTRQYTPNGIRHMDAG